MPFRDKNKVRQYQRDWVRQKRKGSTVTPNAETVTAMEESEAGVLQCTDVEEIKEWSGELSKTRQVKGFSKETK